MRFIYAVENSDELQEYQEFAEKTKPILTEYLAFLKKNYSVVNLPRAIVLTNLETATELISDIPIPAYTNDHRTIFCPTREIWKAIYLKQLDGLETCETVQTICHYYNTKLSANHILQILGHEFVHHSEFFPETDFDCGIWFEEGMCEYISRKYFLTDQEFDEAADNNKLLVDLLHDRFGQHSLEAFGSSAYLRDYSGIFFEYWRSFLAVKKIVEKQDGDIIKVFRSYQKWLSEGCTVPLSTWFHVSV